MKDATFKFECPKCGQKLSFEERHIGKNVSCPSCKANIVVPEFQDQLSEPRKSQPVELYTLWLNNENAGPYTLGQLKSMWATGKVTAKTRYWKEGSTEWKRLLEIASELEGTVQPSESPKIAKAEIPQRKKLIHNKVPIICYLALVVLISTLAGIYYLRHGSHAGGTISPSSALLPETPRPALATATPLPKPASPEYANFVREARRLLTAIGTGINYQDFHNRATEVISSGIEAAKHTDDETKRNAVIAFYTAVADVNDLWSFGIRKNPSARDLGRTQLSGESKDIVSNRWNQETKELVNLYRLSVDLNIDDVYTPYSSYNDTVRIDNAIQYIFIFCRSTFQTLDDER